LVRVTTLNTVPGFNLEETAHDGTLLGAVICWSSRFSRISRALLSDRIPREQHFEVVRGQASYIAWQPMVLVDKISMNGLKSI
jgi:hypothetical protein